MKKTKPQVVISGTIRQKGSEIEKECVLCGCKCYISKEAVEDDELLKGKINCHPMKYQQDARYVCANCALGMSKLVEKLQQGIKKIKNTNKEQL